MTQVLNEYFEALDRLKAGCPVRMSKGAKITNDAVAQEAGRGKGSIKKSRAVFAGLITAIDLAASEQSLGVNKDKLRLDKAKTTAEQYRRELEAALAREVNLVYEVYELRKQIARLTGENVLPIRRG